MMHPLELTLLGGVQFRLGEKRITGFRSSKATALLCYLAVTGMPFARAVVADLFWPEMSESHANDSLRVTLSNLRNLVGDHLLITRHSIAFDVDSPHFLDVRHFQSVVENRAQAIPVEQLKAAVDLYRGDFLAGFHVHDAPAFEQWTAIQQMQLRDLAVRAFHTLVAYYIQQSSAKHALAVDYSRRLLALEPWQEETHQLLMLLLAVGGQPAAAHKQYENCRHVLWKESAVEPGPETEEILARIRRGKLTVEEAVREITTITTRLGVLPMLILEAPVVTPALMFTSETVRPINGKIERTVYE
jgi:DNA-binding SARP family transcriptional activator